MTLVEAPDVLFPSSRFLPLAQLPGGATRVIEHTPGPRRPFAATLGVARRVAEELAAAGPRAVGPRAVGPMTAGSAAEKKPERTSRTMRTTEETSLDGKSQTDTLSDDVTD